MCCRLRAYGAAQIAAAAGAPLPDGFLRVLPALLRHSIRQLRHQGWQHASMLLMLVEAQVNLMKLFDKAVVSGRCSDAAFASAAAPNVLLPWLAAVTRVLVEAAPTPHAGKLVPARLTSAVCVCGWAQQHLHTLNAAALLSHFLQAPRSVKHTRMPWLPFCLPWQSFAALGRAPPTMRLCSKMCSCAAVWSS